MTYEIADKVALVTGGGNGIGRAMCAALAQNGAKVIIVDICKSDGDSTKNDINKTAKHSSVFVQCDVTKTEAIKGKFEELAVNPTVLQKCLKERQLGHTIIEDIVKKFGKLDILVNGAGILDESLNGWKFMVELNLIALIEICRLVIDNNYIGPRGIIVNISSMSAKRATAAPIYAATKGGVTSFSTALGGKQSFNHTNIRVIAIQPGLTDTKINKIYSLLGKQWIQEYTADKTVQDVHGLGQRPEKVADCLIEALRIGKSGSIWSVTNGEWTVENPA